MFQEDCYSGVSYNSLLAKGQAEYTQTKEQRQRRIQSPTDSEQPDFSKRIAVRRGKGFFHYKCRPGGPPRRVELGIYIGSLDSQPPEP